MCANELAEVRKLVLLLSQTQIAIERIILRLETIKELSTIMVDLKPALSALKNVTTNLVSIMPDVAVELDKVNDSIQETLMATKFSSEQPQILNPHVKTPGGEKVLKEVGVVLKQRVSEQLPEPPLSDAVVKFEQPEKIKEMVALAVGCPSSECDEETGSSEAVLSIKDLKMQSISLKIHHSQTLEDRLLDYIKQTNGQVNLPECALMLRAQPEEVKSMLEKLDAQGKIVLET
jgi:hypothetical protein